LGTLKNKNMKFIELTLESGNKVFINTKKIIDMVCIDKIHTTLSFSETYYYKVKETIQEIIHLTN